jgi:hypothetical protein
MITIGVGVGVPTGAWSLGAAAAVPATARPISKAADITAANCPARASLLMADTP